MNAVKPELKETVSLLLRKQRGEIAEFFRVRRLAAGISIEDTARELGLDDPGVLVAFESAREPIPLDMIFALTNYLNIPPEDTLNLIYDLHSAQGRVR